MDASLQATYTDRPRPIGLRRKQFFSARQIASKGGCSLLSVEWVSAGESAVRIAGGYWISRVITPPTAEISSLAADGQFPGIEVHISSLVCDAL